MDEMEMRQLSWQSGFQGCCPASDVDDGSYPGKPEHLIAEHIAVPAAPYGLVAQSFLSLNNPIFPAMKDP